MSGERPTSGAFIFGPGYKDRLFRNDNFQNPSRLSETRTKAPFFYWLGVAAIVLLVLSVIAAAIVLPVVLTRMGSNAVNSTTTTTTTTATTTPSSSTSSSAGNNTMDLVPLIGNFTILNMSPEETNEASLCNLIKDGIETGGQSTGYCSVVIQAGSVRVYFIVDMVVGQNEDELTTLKRASRALALDLANEDNYDIDLNSITFENENGVTEKNCVNGSAQCPGANSQCISVVRGFLCVCKSGYTEVGNSSDCYSVNGTNVTTSSAPQSFCSNVTWVRVSQAQGYNTYWQSDIGNPPDCQARCVAISYCVGITWFIDVYYPYDPRGCYLNFYSAQFYYGYTNYVFYLLIRNQSNCDAEDDCLYVWNGILNQQSLGAVPNSSITTLDGCITTCQNNDGCSSVDWNPTYSIYNASCWLFMGNASTYNPTRYYPNIYHFDKSCRNPNNPYATSPSPTQPSVCPPWAVEFCEPTQQCIYAYQRCDKYQDCPNDIDETNCTCDANHYQCKDGRCIYRSWLCDGVNDCPLKDDESPPQCSVCSSTQFTCGKTHTCIPSITECDGVVNCSDSSDESNCLSLSENTTNPVIVNATYRGQSGYYICSDNWSDSWSDDVCQYMGYGSSEATSFIAVGSSSARFLELNESVDSSNLIAYFQIANCASKQAVAIACAPADCGTRGVPPDSVGPYIINGQRAMPGAWPWQALFETGYYSSDGSFTWTNLCGGILINDRWILTAGHCSILYYGINNARISLGSVSRLGDNDTVYVRVDQAFTNPLYTTYSSYGIPDNDVGLLRLSEPVNITDTVRPICLPSPTQDVSQYRVCVDTGFGGTNRGVNTVSDYLLQARVNIIPYTDCYSYSYYYYGVPVRGQTQICVGTLPTEGDINLCFGDSGGPVACEDANGIWKVIGVNSYQIPSNSFGSCSRSVVARVTAFLSWIQQTIAANSV